MLAKVPEIGNFQLSFFVKWALKESEFEDN